MKQAYVKPSIIIMELQMEQPLLVGSQESVAEPAEFNGDSAGRDDLLWDNLDAQQAI